MAAPRSTEGYLVIERLGGRQERMTFHENQSDVELEVAKLLRRNAGNPPPLSETDVLVVQAIRHSST